VAQLPSGVHPRTRRASPPVALGRRASLFVSAASGRPHALDERRAVDGLPALR
jgi:hypothetical protein